MSYPGANKPRRNGARWVDEGSMFFLLKLCLRIGYHQLRQTVGAWVGIHVRRSPKSSQMGVWKGKPNKEPEGLFEENQSEELISKIRTVGDQKWDRKIWYSSDGFQDATAAVLAGLHDHCKTRSDLQHEWHISLCLAVKQGTKMLSFELFVLFFRPFLPQSTTYQYLHATGWILVEVRIWNLLSNHEAYGRSSIITVRWYFVGCFPFTMSLQHSFLPWTFLAQLWSWAEAKQLRVSLGKMEGDVAHGKAGG